MRPQLTRQILCAAKDGILGATDALEALEEILHLRVEQGQPTKHQATDGKVPRVRGVGSPCHGHG